MVERKINVTRELGAHAVKRRKFNVWQGCSGWPTSKKVLVKSSVDCAQHLSQLGTMLDPCSLIGTINILWVF